MNVTAGGVSTYHYPSQFVGYNSYTTDVKKGTVTVMLIDPATDKVVSQGWATNELNTANISVLEISNSIDLFY